MAKVLNDLPKAEYKVKMYAMADKTADVEEKYINTDLFRGFGNSKLKFGITSAYHGLQYDIIILSHVNLLAIAYLIKILRPSTRIIMYAHGIEVWRPLKKWKRRFLQRSVEIWAVSEFTSKRLQAMHRITRAHIRVLNNCLDPYIRIPETFNKPAFLLDRYQLKNDQPVLFTLTRLSNSELYKGYDLVIETIPKLVEKFPDLRYIIAGKADAKEKKRLQELIGNLNLNDHVSLVGFLPDEELTAHFLLADAFVMPSRKEGFGIVFIEAAACGCQVIAGNQDGSVDALLNGNLGQLVAPDKVSEIENAILTLLSAGNTKERSKEVQEKCLANFSFPKYQAKVEALLSNN